MAKKRTKKMGFRNKAEGKENGYLREQRRRPGSLKLQRERRASSLTKVNRMPFLSGFDRGVKS